MAHPEGNQWEVFVVLDADAATRKTIIDRYAGTLSVLFNLLNRKKV